MDDMVIFTRAFALLDWVLQRSERFPKTHRFGVTQRLQGSAMDLCEALHEANARMVTTERLAELQHANAQLNKLRMYLRLSHDWGWLTGGQFAHVSAMVAEVGRLLGGWMRQTQGRAKQGEKKT